MTQPNESTTNPAAAPDRAGDVRRRPSLRLLLALLVCPAVALAVGLGGYTFIVDGRDGVIALVAGPEAVEAWPQEHRQDPLSQFNTSNLAVDSSRIQVGTPKRDAIPAITGPHTVPVRQAGFLRGDDRVVGVVVDGRARAYPIRILNRHEVVNDTLGSMPIAVLFCPLCDSVTVVERRIECDRRAALPLHHTVARGFLEDVELVQTGSPGRALRLSNSAMRIRRSTLRGHGVVQDSDLELERTTWTHSAKMIESIGGSPGDLLVRHSSIRASGQDVVQGPFNRLVIEHSRVSGNLTDIEATGGGEPLLAHNGFDSSVVITHGSPPLGTVHCYRNFQHSAPNILKDSACP